MNSTGVFLWLDDVRPAPEGWTWVKTVSEAKQQLLAGGVIVASLDHDLGFCRDCLLGETIDRMIDNEGYLIKACTHNGSGYELVCWMEESNIWPSLECQVHSANPSGRDKMLAVIKKHYAEKRDE